MAFVKLSDVIPEIAMLWQRGTVYRLAAQDKMPGVYKRAGTWVVDRTVFDEWLKGPPRPEDDTKVEVPERGTQGAKSVKSPASETFDRLMAARTRQKPGKRTPPPKPETDLGKVGYFDGADEDDDELFGGPRGNGADIAWPKQTTLGAIRRMLATGVRR